MVLLLVTFLRSVGSSCHQIFSGYKSDFEIQEKTHRAKDCVWWVVQPCFLIGVESSLLFESKMNPFFSVPGRCWRDNRALPNHHLIYRCLSIHVRLFSDRGSRDDRSGRDRPSRWGDERGDRGGTGGDGYRGGSVFFRFFCQNQIN